MALPEHIGGYRDVRVVLTAHATGGMSHADAELARAIERSA